MSSVNTTHPTAETKCNHEDYGEGDDGSDVCFITAFLTHLEHHAVDFDHRIVTPLFNRYMAFEDKTFAPWELKLQIQTGGCARMVLVFAPIFEVILILASLCPWKELGYPDVENLVPRSLSIVAILILCVMCSFASLEEEMLDCGISSDIVKNAGVETEWPLFWVLGTIVLAALLPWMFGFNGFLLAFALTLPKLVGRMLRKHWEVGKILREHVVWDEVESTTAITLEDENSDSMSAAKQLDSYQSTISQTDIKYGARAWTVLLFASLVEIIFIFATVSVPADAAIGDMEARAIIAGFVYGTVALGIMVVESSFCDPLFNAAIDSTSTQKVWEFGDRMLKRFMVVLGIAAVISFGAALSGVRGWFKGLAVTLPILVMDMLYQHKEASMVLRSILRQKQIKAYKACSQEELRKLGEKMEKQQAAIVTKAAPMDRVGTLATQDIMTIPSPASDSTKGAAPVTTARETSIPAEKLQVGVECTRLFESDFMAKLSHLPLEGESMERIWQVESLINDELRRAQEAQMLDVSPQIVDTVQWLLNFFSKEYATISDKAKEAESQLCDVEVKAQEDRKAYINHLAQKEFVIEIHHSNVQYLEARLKREQDNSVKWQKEYASVVSELTKQTLALEQTPQRAAEQAVQLRSSAVYNSTHLNGDQAKVAELEGTLAGLEAEKERYVSFGGPADAPLDKSRCVGQNSSSVEGEIEGLSSSEWCGSGMLASTEEASGGEDSDFVHLSEDSDGCESFR